jgi:hypothetical protein
VVHKRLDLSAVRSKVNSRQSKSPVRYGVCVFRPESLVWCAAVPRATVFLCSLACVLARGRM